MQVTISRELEEFVEMKVRSGDYASAESVVEDAIARLRAEEMIDPAELTRLVVEGQAEADRGELIDSETVFQEIREESLKRRGKTA